MYELMKGERLAAGGNHARAPIDHHDASDFEAAPTMTWLDWIRSGRMIRLPAGYVFLGIAAVLLLLVVAYMFGYARGENTTADDSVADNAAEFSIKDPLASPHLTEPGSPITNNNAPRRTTPNANSNTSSAQQATTSRLLPIDMAKLGPINSEPRKRGINYFTLAETNPLGAERLAHFCRDHGLAAFVVKSRSDRLKRVIVLPGFESSARSTPAVKELESRIIEVGRKWKAAEPGATDLSDAYADRFEG
jgi:hypothetical protein